MLKVRFSVTVDVNHDGSVCLVGDSDELGNWEPTHAVVLNLDHHQENEYVWSVIVSLDRRKMYSYRYFICDNQKSLGAENKSVIAIHQWETNIKPRQLDLTTVSSSKEEFTIPTSTFGDYDGDEKVSRGWLLSQSEIQVRLDSDPFHIWKHRPERLTYVKCVTVDYSQQQDLTLSEIEGPHNEDKPSVLYSNLSKDDCVPGCQGPNGAVFNKGDYLVFKAQVLNTEHMGFQLNYFEQEGNKGSRYIGCSHILPVGSLCSQVKRKLPILGVNNKPIGEITVDLLVVKPLSNGGMKMDVTYQGHWKWRGANQKSLDIGHRGMGASYSQLSTLKENTLASFDAAGKHGADFVEFDVMLSKDRTPVIYHDFYVRAFFHNKRKHNVKSDYFEIPVSCLTLEQLQSMKLFNSGSETSINDEDESIESLEPFPTLAKCLQTVDLDTGFNIEVKFPQQTASGEWEQENYMDVNEAIDIILHDVFRNAQNRKIVFSSFDPDTCILLQRKQNRYPVLFLNMGNTQRYELYKDYRCSSFKTGVQFALSEHLLGVALHTEVLLRDMSVIDWVQKKQLVLFVWGEENNHPELIRNLREKHVDGIIYDRIDHHKPELHVS